MKKHQWTYPGRRNIQSSMARLKEAAAELFHYNTYHDSEIIDFIMFPAISLKWKYTAPLWMQIIGAPGCGKTAHLSLYNFWKNAVFVSRLSKNSLISGFRPDGDIKKDPSLLPLLDNKILIVKDFTCILQGPKEEREAVVGQLRDIFDGKASRVFGNIGLQEYTQRFNMVLAVTHVIDGYYSISTQLGERFISRREYTPNRYKITEAAFDNARGYKDNTKLYNLQIMFMEHIESSPDVNLDEVEWSDKFKKKAVAGADFIATCRSHVMRERDGRSIAACPSPEVGTRLVTQIIQTVSSYCIVNGIEEVNEQAWQFGGAKVLCDTLPTAISWTLSKIYSVAKYGIRRNKKKIEFTVKDLLPLTRLGWQTTDKIVTDLYHNGILQARYVGITGRRNAIFSLTEESFDILNFTGILSHLSEKNMDICHIVESVTPKERAHHTKKRRKKEDM